MLCFIAQLYLTLCDPIDSHRGSRLPLWEVDLCDPIDPIEIADQTPLSIGILQARILEWVAMPSSRGSSQSRDWTHFSGIAGGFFTLSLQGSPRIMEWVAYPFSRGSSRSRNWTTVSCIAGRFITSWAICEAPRMATGSEIEGRGFKSKLLKLWIQTFPTTLHWNSFITTVVFFLCCCCCCFSFFPGPKPLINKASTVCKIIRNFLPG